MPFRADPLTHFTGRQTSRPRCFRRAASAPSTKASRAGKPSALTTAVRLRRALHSAIVQAFRRQLQGTGAGPTEAQLRRFARTAIVEERLQRALGGTDGRRAPTPWRGESK